MAHGARGLAGLIPLGDCLYDMASDAWERYSRACEGEGRRAEIQTAAEAVIAVVKREAEAVAAEVRAAAGQSLQAELNTPKFQQNLAAYLIQIQASIRRSLRRPNDPSGKSLPPDFVLQEPEHMLSLLPERLSRFQPGERPIGNWILTELLGTGGFCEVWKAKHAEYDGISPVALKFCVDLDADAARHLRHEAILMSELGQVPLHGIVSLRNAWLEQEPYCLEYDYVNGGDLCGLMAEWNGLSPEKRVIQVGQVIYTLASTVAAFHRRNRPVVHRDLKPANVLVHQRTDESIELRISDFGLGGVAARKEIARSKSGTSRGHNLISALRGSYTPLYASPQQIRGDPADPRDDVHALGVMWFQLLMGSLQQRPGSDFAEDLRHLGVPPKMIGLLGKCIASAAERRLPDAAVLVEELQSLLTGRMGAGLWSQVGALVSAPANLIRPWLGAKSSSSAPAARVAPASPASEPVSPQNDRHASVPEGSKGPALSRDKQKAAGGYSTNTPPSPQVRQKQVMGLRLLVFGLPNSGKSSLLGALVQASASQAAVLKGQVADATGKLAELRKRTYNGSLSAMTGDMTAYPVQFVPEGEGTSPVAATLLDGDGRLAQEYLAGKRVLEARDSGLSRAILDADTVILTFDPTAAGGPVEPRLAAFAHFLTLLQEVRGRRADVADLPVYLVLTKCDELARPGDTFSKWLERMEDAKRKLGERFTAFLADDPDAPPFGTIDLQLWAIAIGRPPLADRPAPAAEPVGVAELFRQCLAAAEGFDRRERQASRRLERTVGGLGFLVVMLALLAGLFVAAQPDTERTRLEEELQTILAEPDASADRRLREPLEYRLKQLDQLLQDPGFDKLPDKTRDAVRRAGDEWTEYLRARQEFQARVKQPYRAKNEQEFDVFEKEARDFALPIAYRSAWAETRVAEQLARIRHEYASVRTAITAEVQWVRTQIAEGKKLDEEGNAIPAELTAPDPMKQKQGRQHAVAWFDACSKYVSRPYLRLPGDQPITETAAFTYGDLRKFRTVVEARKEWDEVKSRLDRTYKYVLSRTTD